MERISPADVFRARLTILQRKCETLERSLIEQKKLVNHWRARHHEMQRSREKWKEKAKARRKEIERLQWQLDVEHARHPFRSNPAAVGKRRRASVTCGTSTPS